VLIVSKITPFWCTLIDLNNGVVVLMSDVGGDQPASPKGKNSIYTGTAYAFPQELFFFWSIE